MTIYTIIQSEEKNWMKQFLDYSKSRKKFYENVYIEEENLVIKIPLNNHDNGNETNFLIEQFDITKYVYLTKIS
ncbi:MAG: hypothetical protein ACFFBH_16070 [Promethearchaeota archaeon]